LKQLGCLSDSRGVQCKAFRQHHGEVRFRTHRYNHLLYARGQLRQDTNRLLDRRLHVVVQSGEKGFRNSIVVAGMIVTSEQQTSA
jgi:hypothetical protein